MRLTISYFNKIIGEAYEKFVTTAGPTIRESFVITGISPLQPPTADIVSSVEKGCASALHLVPGQEANEINQTNKKNLENSQIRKN